MWRLWIIVLIAVPLAIACAVGHWLGAWAGVGTFLLLIGLLVSAIGWFLNMNTPIQQPLPAIFGPIALLGFLILFKVL